MAKNRNLSIQLVFFWTQYSVVNSQETELHITFLISIKYKVWKEDILSRNSIFVKLFHSIVFVSVITLTYFRGKKIFHRKFSTAEIFLRYQLTCDKMSFVSLKEIELHMTFLISIKITTRRRHCSAVVMCKIFAEK